MANEDKPTADAPQDGGTLAGDSQTKMDDAYRDKSLEDVIKMHKELKSHSDRQLETIKGEKDKEMETLRKDLQAYESWYQNQQTQTSQQPQTTQQAPVDKSKIVDALLDDPVTTLNNILNYRDQQKMYQEAYSDGPMALQRAKKDRPDIFDGIDDNQLQQIVYGGIQSGTLHPSLATKPEAWMMAAGQTKLVQSDFKFDAPPINPTNPPQGDKPPATKTQVDEPGDEAPITSDAKFLVQELQTHSPDEVNLEKVKERVQKIREDRERSGG